MKIIKSKIERLEKLFKEELVPLVRKKDEETFWRLFEHVTFEHDPLDHESGRVISRLKESLQSLYIDPPTTRSAQEFPETQFHFVQKSLQALNLLNEKELIPHAPSVITSFFNSNRVVKVVGKYLVQVFGPEGYPDFQRLVSFKPDFQFLKTDLTTSSMHWWLNYDVEEDGIRLYKWEGFLQESYIKRFHWKGLSSRPCVEARRSLISDLKDIITQALVTNDPREFLASFWMVRFVMTYSVMDDLSKILAAWSKDFMIQYRLTEAVLEMHEFLNRSYRRQSSFSSEAQIFSSLQHEKHWANFSSLVPTDPQDLKKFKQIQARCGKLLETLDANNQSKDRVGINSLLKSTLNLDSQLLLNGWLQPVNVQLTITKSTKSSVDSFDKRLSNTKPSFRRKIINDIFKPEKKKAI
ncbi:uncharacterized protein PGTG_10075 [Puccinia graminis f. sp. tritici CRL 75-36-700-3]|uniref:Uncharacterized protein n=1 Tax=Puccinia graminis f. sp. tritici (strain CRL 75-36-700-3 / race SCCL) TaxID=418459 RepID=E3KJ80_PUCGT|nr:uncharacterized protein PGTG_10075 [Puccinia graminis f. sp. tritici CRL 75-36-700-3]EFP84355.2 hypothetical protein PGTG_10075 [Puccinia graminis f. sp. tritici CRL 75-36-700-3]